MTEKKTFNNIFKFQDFKALIYLGFSFAFGIIKREEHDTYHPVSARKEFT